MVLLEIVIIGGAVYYYKKRHKVNKARKAAFLAGQPFSERDGSVSYPPSHPGLPPYSAPDNKIQYGGPTRDYYSDTPAPAAQNLGNEKSPSYTESREIAVRDEKI